MVGGFYALPYFICPGHYVYEGMILCLFDGDDRNVTANAGTEFYAYLNCPATTADTEEVNCTGTVDQYIDSFFGGEFVGGNNRVAWNAAILGFILVITRVLTFVCLKYIRFS
jgi:hypothetical protein